MGVLYCWIYVFSSCLRSPRKIDSSIGLPSLNKVVTIISVCLPDGTVQVTNPNVGVYSHVFAVQDEGVSAAVKCTVSTSGAQSNITGCSQVCKIQNNNCYFFHGSINTLKP